MAGEGVAGAEGAVLRADCLPDPGGADGGTKRLVAARKALGDGHDVGLHPVMFQRAPGAAAAGAGHDLVRDHQNAVAGADLAHGLRIAGGGRDAAAGGADDGLEDEGGDGLGAGLQDCGLKRGSGGGTCGFGGGTGDRAVVIGRRDLDRGDEGTFISQLFFQRNQTGQGRPACCRATTARG